MKKLTLVVGKIIHAEKEQAVENSQARLKVVFQDGGGNIFELDPQSTGREICFDGFEFDTDELQPGPAKVMEPASLSGRLVRLALDSETNRLAFVGSLIKPYWVHAEQEPLTDADYEDSAAALADLQARDQMGILGASGDHFIVVRIEAKILFNRGIIVWLKLKGLNYERTIEADFGGCDERRFTQFLEGLMEVTQISEWDNINGRFVRLQECDGARAFSVAPLMGGDWQILQWKW